MISSTSYISHQRSQRSYLLYQLMILSIVLGPVSEVALRLFDQSLFVLAAQFILLVATIVFTRFEEKFHLPGALLFIIVFGCIILYFLRDVLERQGVNLDALGNILRCLAFAKLAFSMRENPITDKQIENLSKIILGLSFLSVILIRAAGFENSIRLEVVLLPLVWGLFLVKQDRRKIRGAVFVIFSLAILLGAQKASLFLASFVAVGVMFPIVWIISLFSGVLLLGTFGLLLEYLQFSDTLGRFAARIPLFLEVFSSFDRGLLGRLTSNRSEEYFFLFDQWSRSGFPIWGSGLSATIFIEAAEIERSTFHNLFVNLVRIFGVASIVFFALIGRVVTKAYKTSRLVLAIVAGLLAHNLLTFSLFHSPLLFLMLLFFRSSKTSRNLVKYV